MDTDFEKYLRATSYLDWGAPLVRGVVDSLLAGIYGEAAKAVRIFEYVRDRVPYTPYVNYFDRSLYIASNIIRRNPTFCIPKAILLGAMARAAGIPSRLRFAFIRNHQMSPKLKELLGNDVLYHHGFVELYIRDRWVKATPAYDSAVSAQMNVPVVLFDGFHDATLPSHDLKGDPHVEYLQFSEAFDDAPEDYLLRVFDEKYGHNPALADAVKML